MPLEKTHALVLRTIDYSETSKVVTFFTRGFGKVRTLAKGGRRLKSAFEAALDLLTVCNIVFLRKQSDSLDILTEAELVERFGELRKNLSALYSAYYVAELLTELTDDYDPHPQLFDEALATLGRLARLDGATQAGAAPALVVLRFELALLRELGYLPSLHLCVGCGQAVATAGRMFFGLTAGGVLCTRCRPGQRRVVTIHGGTTKVLEALADPRRANWGRLKVAPRLLAEVRSVMGQYVSHLMGRRPKMLDYLT